MDFIGLFEKDISDLWKNHKWFLLFFGVLIVLYKFRNIIIDLLISGAQEEVRETQKKDSKLKSEQDVANSKANSLIEEASEIGKNSPEVKEDWYKKDD